MACLSVGSSWDERGDACIAHLYAIGSASSAAGCCSGFQRGAQGPESNPGDKLHFSPHQRGVPRLLVRIGEGFGSRMGCCDWPVTFIRRDLALVLVLAAHELIATGLPSRALMSWLPALLAAQARGLINCSTCGPTDPARRSQSRAARMVRPASTRSPFSTAWSAWRSRSFTWASNLLRWSATTPPEVSESLVCTAWVAGSRCSLLRPEPRLTTNDT